MDNNHLVVQLQVVGAVWQEDGQWIAGFPRLEVFSSGGSQEEARSNAREALQLWVESCVERRTLEAALQELGWEPATPPGAAGPRFLGGDSQPWLEGISVPAYQAAELAADCR